MKKLIASFALVLFLFGVSFGQGSNTSTITQTGNESVTNVTQTGSTNTITAAETGYMNNAQVDQLGNLNNASILVNPTSNNNSERWNVVHTFLVPNSLLSYGGTMNGNGVTQTGNSNSASVNITGDYNVTGVGQIGNSDVSTVIQIAPIFGGQNWVAVDQLSGNLNVAYQKQVGTDLQGYLLQNGTSNNAHVEQYQFNANSEVIQDGNNNFVTQNITGSAVPWDGSGSSASAYEIGNANYAVQLQSGGVNNTSLITTIGNNNGVLGHEVKTEQTGNDNSATIEMGLLGAVNSNWAVITQTGDLNTASISVEHGDFNTAIVQQLSSGNTATIHQNGVSNQINLVQQ